MKEGIRVAGIGIVGSGGIKVGMAKEVLVEGGHFFPSSFDDVPRTGKHVLNKLENEVDRYRKIEEK